MFRNSVDAEIALSQVINTNSPLYANLHRICVPDLRVHDIRISQLAICRIRVDAEQFFINAFKQDSRKIFKPVILTMMSPYTTHRSLRGTLWGVSRSVRPE